ISKRSSSIRTNTAKATDGRTLLTWGDERSADPWRGPSRLGTGPRRVPRELRLAWRGRRRLRRLPARQEGRRPVGRLARSEDQVPVGAGHDGPGVSEAQGRLVDGAGAGPLARAVQLRRKGREVLARVRAERKRAGPRAPAPPASSGAVRHRRAD